MTRIPTEPDPTGVERLLTAQEIADRLRVSDKWIYKAAADRKLPSVKMGRYLRFRAADVQSWIERGGTEVRNWD